MKSPAKRNNVTALDLVREAIKKFGDAETLILAAKARTRGEKPSETDLLRISEALLMLDFETVDPLMDWAKSQMFWIRFDRRHRAGRRAARKAKR